MFKAKKKAEQDCHAGVTIPAAENAMLEGADVIEHPEVTRIPIRRGDLYSRLDSHLRQYESSALLSAEQPRANILAPVMFDVFEADLRNGGRVRHIDLIERAKQLGLISENESPCCSFGLGQTSPCVGRQIAPGHRCPKPW
jgi:hypothetical protein